MFFFNLGDEAENDTNSFFRKSEDLVKPMDKVLDKYDDHSPIYYTRDVFINFKTFKQVNRSEHGRRADYSINLPDYEGETVKNKVEMRVFLNAFTIFSKQFDQRVFRTHSIISKKKHRHDSL